MAGLRVGVYRSVDQGAEITRMQAVVGPLPILDLDRRAAEVFGRIVGALQDAGTPIGDIAALIASVCVVGGHSVLTRNTAHFALVPGLAVLSY
ncbi:type II toxin-antitoxin system VapC family toxin [Candidatus Binatia bacterium]|nr:type II toxin-antitoxin system VapC family toxin [Planctomycetota bacterium]MCK6557554.1 type II toxin-antitoxin system VapC family toxin [Candidatus Binatia bacterium]